MAIDISDNNHRWEIGNTDNQNNGRMLTDAQDTTDSNYNSINNSITDLQFKVNSVNSSISQLMNMSNTLKSESSGAISIMNSYIQKNLDTNVANLLSTVITHQKTISSLQKMVTQIGSRTGTTGPRSNDNLFNYILALTALVFIILLVTLLKKN